MVANAEALPALSDTTRDVAKANTFPHLKAVQRKFVIAILDGATPLEAFLRANPKAQKWQRHSALNRAAAIYREPAVVEALRQANLAMLAINPATLNHHVAKLRSIQQRCEDAGDMGEARRCEVNIGQVSRLYVTDVVHHDATPRTPEELVRLLAPGNPEGQQGILEAIRAARAKPVTQDVDLIEGSKGSKDVSD